MDGDAELILPMVRHKNRLTVRWDNVKFVFNNWVIGMIYFNNNQSFNASTYQQQALSNSNLVRRKGKTC